MVSSGRLGYVSSSLEQADSRSAWLRNYRHVTAGFSGVRGTIRAVVSSLIFFIRAFPMLPSTPVDWLTRPPVVDKVSYPTRAGRASSDVYVSGSRGPHPGVVVSLGVVPLGKDHPQVARIAQALARAGFAALMHCSPAMRDLRLDADEVEDLVSAYETLLAQPYVNPARSGLLGTCVGGSFALMAAAHPRVRDRISFVSAYAPYSSMWTFARDIVGATRTLDGEREPWLVDQITWRVFVRSLTDSLPPQDAQRLREALEDRYRWDASRSVVQQAPVGRSLDPAELSADGQAVLRLLSARDPDSADAALRLLPPLIQARLTALSPVQYLPDVKAPLIHLMHDRYDTVIPVGESRRLKSALSTRKGVHYRELGFRHLNPTMLSPLRLARELPRFYLAVYPIFRQVMGQMGQDLGVRRRGSSNGS